MLDLYVTAVLVPDAEDRATVHRAIYDELALGRVEDRSRAAYRGKRPVWPALRLT